MQTPISNNAIQVAQGKGGEVFFYFQCFICRKFESESISVFSLLCQARNQKERQKLQNVVQPTELSLNLTFFKRTCCENSEGRSLAGFFVKFGTKPILPSKEKRQEQQHPRRGSQAWRLV